MSYSFENLRPLGFLNCKFKNQKLAFSWKIWFFNSVKNWKTGIGDSGTVCIVDLSTLTKSQLSELASCMDIYYLMFALLYFLYRGKLLQINGTRVFRSRYVKIQYWLSWHDIEATSSSMPKNAQKTQYAHCPACKKGLTCPVCPVSLYA